MLPLDHRDTDGCQRLNGKNKNSYTFSLGNQSKCLMLSVKGQYHSQTLPKGLTLM